MTLLFQGDSITDAYRKPEELNPAFQLGNGYVFLIAAKLALSELNSDVHVVNRGVSGHTLSDLEARWQEDALDQAPDVLTMLVGVNSTIRAMKRLEVLEGEEFANCYRSLLNRVLVAKPDCRFILMEPFLLEVGVVTGAWLRHLEIQRKTVRKLAREFGATFIPLQSIFDAACARFPKERLVWDGIHPTHVGFQLIADAWLRETDALHQRLSSQSLLSVS